MKKNASQGTISTIDSTETWCVRHGNDVRLALNTYIVMDSKSHIHFGHLSFCSSELRQISRNFIQAILMIEIKIFRNLKTSFAHVIWALIAFISCMNVNFRKCQEMFSKNAKY